MMQTTELNTQDIIDVRDIIERVEELENERDNYTAKNRDGYQTMIGADWHGDNPQNAQELETLQAILEELKGMGGDEQWRGDWYPLQLIRESHFTDYAQQLAEDCGMVNSNAKWPNNCIDWELAARDLKVDYSIVEIDGVTYYFR